MMPTKMCVLKRDGREERVMFDKITSRIAKLCYGLDMNFVDPASITMKVITGIYPGVTTVQLDELAAEISATMTTCHSDYAILAARIAVSNLHKETKKNFSDVIRDLYEMKNEVTGTWTPMISEKIYNIIQANAERLNSAIIYDRDFHYNYFGFKTLFRSYLLRIGNKVVERPQQMLMRVAVGIHHEDIDAAIETYNLMSDRWFTHASPTLFNSGTCGPQLSSCFLLTMSEDSIEGIYDTLKQCAIISKSAGGIGVNVHCIRAAGSYISGTNGYSNGLVPMLRVYNNTARYVDQGGNKRPGAFAIYLEPWHSDIFEFLDLRKNTGSDELRARDLFYALWVPDLFMKRVQSDSHWSLMCPHECPGLEDCWGEEFETLYERYEKEKRYKRQVRAQDLWYAIVEAQIETGNPYMLYKDHCNRKTNQQNLGTIKCSNLCCEVVQYSSKDEIAVCNLASLALNRFVNKEDRTFNFEKLREIVKVVTNNLNRIIDVNYYPLPEAERSNKRHRPIGIGVQGLADTFILMRYPFESNEAKLLNTQIFETIYYGALEASCELAQRDGTYETYSGSPVSKGILQYDMWNVTPTDLWNWQELKEKIAKHGVRNSLLVAPMPTASTAQILGNNESIEPYTSNIYTRRVLSGEFQVVNHHLLLDLTERGIWNDQLKMEIIANRGSIQNISDIPDDIKALYKTVWEIPQKRILEMAADRGAYIDQSQSLNVHIAEPTMAKITSMHFFGWKIGLKTGMYYLRTKPAAQAIQFTVDKTKIRSTISKDKQVVENSKKKPTEEEILACSLENREACLMFFMLMSRFDNVEAAPSIELFALSKSYKKDTNPIKVDFSIGEYRTEDGKPWILPVVHRAKTEIANKSFCHYEYLSHFGIKSFTKLATSLLLGSDHPVLHNGRCFSVQTISGTGALRLGAEYLCRVDKFSIVYIPEPTWPNHRLIFEHAGFTDIRIYRYGNSVQDLSLNIDGMLSDLRKAPENSVIILHACAQNQIGVDPNIDQWKQIADVLKQRKLFPFFDCAYQGLAYNNIDTDCFSVRYFVSIGFDLFCAQSLAKNFGLYNERIGNLVCVVRNPQLISSIKSQLTLLICGNYYEPPSYGALIVSHILSNDDLFEEWKQNLQTMSERIRRTRIEFQTRLKQLKTPGDWSCITRQVGMFANVGSLLSSNHLQKLSTDYHIYIPSNGRLNICGLNRFNIDYVANAFKSVIEDQNDS